MQIPCGVDGVLSSELYKPDAGIETILASNSTMPLGVSELSQARDRD